MTVVVDAGPLVALLDASDRLHARTRRFFESTQEPLCVSPFVLAEADYLVARDLGIRAELHMLADFVNGNFLLEVFGPQDIEACLDVIARYDDLDLGLADASSVVIAGRRGTDRVATFDERHFRAVRTLRGQPFVLLPADG